MYKRQEQGPERPLALTFRPLGDTDAERARAVTTMWREVREASSQVEVHSVTITPFIDDPQHLDRPGIATATRVLKDSGQAFIDA